MANMAASFFLMILKEIVYDQFLLLVFIYKQNKLLIHNEGFANLIWIKCQFSKYNLKFFNRIGLLF